MIVARVLRTSLIPCLPPDHCVAFLVSAHTRTRFAQYITHAFALRFQIPPGDVSARSRARISNDCARIAQGEKRLCTLRAHLEINNLSLQRTSVFLLVFVSARLAWSIASATRVPPHELLYLPASRECIARSHLFNAVVSERKRILEHLCG